MPPPALKKITIKFVGAVSFVDPKLIIKETEKWKKLEYKNF